MKDKAILIGEHIHQFVEAVMQRATSEVEKSVIDACTYGHGIVVTATRGNKLSYKRVPVEEFVFVGDSITFSTHDNVYLQPAIRPELTDYDPRGSDRIKGPKGPRTKWGKIK